MRLFEGNRLADHEASTRYLQAVQPFLPSTGSDIRDWKDPVVMADSGGLDILT